MLDEQQVRKIIREELSGLFASDRYVFQRLLQLADGRNIQVGLTTGTKIALNANQKIAFHGANPVVQAGAIATPNTQGATYNQTDVTTLKTAIDAIRTVLINKGLTA